MSKILKNKFAIVITLIFLGVFSSFSLPPYNYFFINFFTFPFLFYILVFNLNNNLINNFLTGWFYGFGYFCSNLYWISNSLKFDENFENLVVFSIIFIPFLLSFLYGLFSFLLKFLNLKMNFSSILIFSLLLSIIEYLRGNIFGGFPWNLISFSMVNLTSSLQILNLIGTYSFNLIVITIYCLPTIIIFKFNRLKKVFIFLSVILILIINYFYGNNRIEQIQLSKKKQIYPTIKLISPSFNIERFFIEEPIINKLKELMEIGHPFNKDFLLVFPEGISDNFELNDLRNSNSFNKISNQLNANSKIIIGISYDDGEKIFNSLALLNSKFVLEDKYSKNKLVPFGEFLPFEKFLSNFGLKKITYGYRSFSSSNETCISFSFPNFDLAALAIPVSIELMMSSLSIDFSRATASAILNNSNLSALLLSICFTPKKNGPKPTFVIYNLNMLIINIPYISIYYFEKISFLSVFSHENEPSEPGSLPK